MHAQIRRHAEECRILDTTACCYIEFTTQQHEDSEQQKPIKLCGLPIFHQEACTVACTQSSADRHVCWTSSNKTRCT